MNMIANETVRIRCNGSMITAASSAINLSPNKLMKDTGPLLANSDSVGNMVPSKPKRMSTLKKADKPSSNLSQNRAIHDDIDQNVKKTSVLQDDQIEHDYDQINDDYELLREEKRQRRIRMLPPSVPQSPDSLTIPNLNHYQSIYSLRAYKCMNMIGDQSKRLDRTAISEIKNLFKFVSDYQPNIDPNLTSQFSMNLAKFICYEDLELLRFNVDFGLGCTNGLEVLVLPQGGCVRTDVIDRHKTFKLFLILIILLVDKSQRIGCLCALIDTSFYLFDKLRNFYGFSYVMEALNSDKVQGLTHTWNSLKESNEAKFNLFKHLSYNYKRLANGDYSIMEKDALIPNIYPIALLLALNPETFVKSGDGTSDELLIDYNNYKWKTDTYLTQNSKYYLQHSNEYNKRYNNFLGTDFECLYDLRVHESLKKLHFSTQTEFQQIILWSNDFKTYTNCISNQTTPYDINLRCNDFNKILDVLLTKIQS